MYSAKTDTTDFPHSSFAILLLKDDLTIEDTAKLIEVAYKAGMDILGPPLTDEQVSAIVNGEAFNL